MPFPHEKLVVYQRSLEFLASIAPVVEKAPKGWSRLGDQLRRAAWSMPLPSRRTDSPPGCPPDSSLPSVGDNRRRGPIAEAAGRWSPGDKARFFGIARGSCYECAAVLDVWSSLVPSSRPQVLAAKAELEEIGRMLTALVKNRLPPECEEG